MQFQYNADHPSVSPATGETVRNAPARPPLEFPSVQPVPCAKITTRVYHPGRNQVATVQNVLVRTPAVHHNNVRRRPSNVNMTDAGADADIAAADDNMSSSSSDSDDDSMSTEEEEQVDDNEQQQQQDCAYWIQRTIREAIYGRVLFATVLRRRKKSEQAARTDNPGGAGNVEWEVTSDRIAVKEMSWQHIRRERDRLAEDPIKEVAAMQYLKGWYEARKNGKNGGAFLSPLPPPGRAPVEQVDGDGGDDIVSCSFQAMKETNIMMPLDLLSDERHLYSIMPYCDGGELFERLDLNERFPEEEARYWMKQVLNVSWKMLAEKRRYRRRYKVSLFTHFFSHYAPTQGIENLQNAGICHRDLSLENLLVHETGALIIDMGMCLRLPTVDGDDGGQQVVSTTTTAGLSASFKSMSMNGGRSTVGNAVTTQQVPPVMDLEVRKRKRALVLPQGTCGKWVYMSPEIYKNKEPFDGYAVDMWAAGVILFLMLTGFPPWERACQTDERFKYMTAGYLVQMLTEWDIGISSDGMDLLQRMLFLDPKDRLSLDQVRAHPWMVNGRSEVPR
jgi:serine/threonine protein kinase